MKATLKQAKKILELFEDTPNEQLQALLASGFLTGLRDANIAEIERDEFRELIKLPFSPLLESLDTITIPETTERFIAHERFIKDISENARVKIAYIDPYFKDRFFEKIEKPIPEMILRYSRLVRPARDNYIIKKLGYTTETFLSQMYVLMERQKNGEIGILLNNGLPNIFYISDFNGYLCVVFIRWVREKNGWFVDAIYIHHPKLWEKDLRIFSHEF